MAEWMPPQPSVSDAVLQAAQAPAFRANQTALPALVLQKINVGTGPRSSLKPVECPTNYAVSAPIRILAPSSARNGDAARQAFLNSRPAGRLKYPAVPASERPSFNANREVPWQIASLGDTSTLPGAESVRIGAAIVRQVSAMQDIQQNLYAALASLEPSAARRLFGADSPPAYLRQQVDAWNTQVNRWWKSDFTSRASQDVNSLTEWIDLGKALIADADTLAGRIEAKTLVARIRAFARTYADDMESVLTRSLQVVGNVAREGVKSAGGVANEAAGQAAGIFGKLSWGVIVPVVGALGALALGVYMLKRGGLKADVGVGPARVGIGGLSSLHARRARRRR